MTTRRQYRVQVIRDDFVIESRTAPAALAEQYANVVNLRYPNDVVRCDLVTEVEPTPLGNRSYSALN